MTIAHVEKFAELVGKDPALYAKFGYEKLNEVVVADMPAKVAWMTSAVNEAKALGLDFNAEEALSFLEKSYRGAAAGGELSDLQLEAVAGGKGPDISGLTDADKRNQNFHGVQRNAERMVDTMSSWFKGW